MYFVSYQINTFTLMCSTQGNKYISSDNLIKRNYIFRLNLTLKLLQKSNNTCHKPSLLKC